MTHETKEYEEAMDHWLSANAKAEQEFTAAKQRALDDWNNFVADQKRKAMEAATERLTKPCV